MKRFVPFFLLALSVLLNPGTVTANSIRLYGWALNINGDISGTRDRDIPEHLEALPANIYDDSDFDWASGLGRLRLNLSPTNAGALGRNSIIVFFDHDISPFYDDERGAGGGNPAPGQTWEIDEPGFYPVYHLGRPGGFPDKKGDIFDHVKAGKLDNQNFNGEFLKDDVSMAMGWEFSLNENEFALIDFMVSQVDPSADFYLFQSDPIYKNSGHFTDYNSIYLSSTLQIQAIPNQGTGTDPQPVPNPGTILLLGSGLLGLVGLAKKTARKRPNRPLQQRKFESFPS